MSGLTKQVALRSSQGLLYQAVFHETPEMDADGLLDVLGPLLHDYRAQYFYMVDTTDLPYGALQNSTPLLNLERTVYFTETRGTRFWDGPTALYARTQSLCWNDFHLSLWREGNAFLFGKTDLPATLWEHPDTKVESLWDTVLRHRINVLTFTDHVMLHILTYDTTLIDQPPLAGYTLIDVAEESATIRRAEAQ